MEIKELLLFELDVFAASIAQYRDAIEREDKDALTALLAEGRKRKEEVDGK